MGRRGRERALAEFSVERHVERVIALYDEILEPAGRSRQRASDEG
jgi:hypothetical protein